MNAEVLIEIKAKNLDKTFTYKIPDNLVEKIFVGSRVLVPFGRQELEGFVLKITDEKCDYDLKEAIDVIDEYPVLNKELLELGKYISKKTLCTLINAYQAMLPKALKAKKGVVINKKYYSYLVLNKNVDDIKKAIKSQKQIDIINKISEETKVLKSLCMKISSYSVNILLEKEYIKEIKEEIYRLNTVERKIESKKQLNDEQKKCFSTVKNSLNVFKPFLLHGVTGSGKTEVYMQLIAEVIKSGKEAIVLVPEISLTPQLVNNFHNRFGSNVAILHSRLSDGEKYDEWRKIERREVSIVIGARSAIFAPFTNLGIIIIDEEHSTTYKQENNPRYSAIDIALYRAKKYKIPVVLGSATPSIESYTRGIIGNYELIEMTKRINNNLPKVSLIDMKEEIRKGNRVLSETLIEGINDCIKNNEQVIILLNRRGYSTVLTCSNCGYTHKCPNCDIPLTYHKTSDTMRCHYCGYGSNKITRCPSCKNGDLNYLGMGTEKLEQYINDNIKNARTIRMDVDTTSTKGSHEKIIEAFGMGKHNILIGTQMIAKGLDFSNVTLVGVICGDASLNIPDFRSAERTFQLLNQVAGRAGRGKKKGNVVIQGFNMNHYSIIDASKHDYKSFYKEEMNIRRSLNYPPYYNLCLIKIKGINYELVSKEANKIAEYLKRALDKCNYVLGPSSSIVPKINNNYFFNIIIKYKKIDYIIDSMKFIQNQYKTNKKVNVDIDFNPNQI